MEEFSNQNNRSLEYYRRTAKRCIKKLGISRYDEDFLTDVVTSIIKSDAKFGENERIRMKSAKYRYLDLKRCRRKKMAKSYLKIDRYYTQIEFDIIDAIDELMKMSEQKMKCYIYRYLYCMTYGEIATTLDISYESVRKEIKSEQRKL